MADEAHQRGSSPHPDQHSAMIRPPRPPRRGLPHEFPGAIWYHEEEVEAVTRVLRAQSPFRYYGPAPRYEVDQLEDEFARFLASKPQAPWPDESPMYVTAVNSGTGALEVALDALGVGEGDEVVVQGFMWISTISAIIRCRATPILIDSDDTLNLDPYALREVITPHTKAVIPVPMLGGCTRIGALMEEVRTINAERSVLGFDPIRVLEDCAQAMGATALGIPGSLQPCASEGLHRVGTFGDVGIFSLQINKNITAGEGGLIVTRDLELHRRIDALHNCGYARGEDAPVNWYGDDFVGWGHGRRLSELQGAVARVQLRRLDELISRMSASHDRLEEVVHELGFTTRGRADASRGDTGYYLCFQLPQAPELDEEQLIARGRAVAEALAAWELRPWFMHDFEVHVYYNIEGLVDQAPLAGSASWPRTPDSANAYLRGALPKLDALFVHTIGINIPSQLSLEDEAHIAAVLRYVLYDLSPTV